MLIRSKSEKIARIISTLFVPPSLTVLIFTYFAFALEEQFYKSAIVFSVALFFGFILPVIMFFYMRKHKMIADSDATIKEQRTTPFFIAILMYLAGLFVLVYAGTNIITISFWFCYISNTLIVISINKFWKISAHALGVAGPLGAITYALGWSGFLFVILLILVGWSRLKLKVHTPAQVIAGSIMGFVFTYFQIGIIIRIINHVP